MTSHDMEAMHQWVKRWKKTGPEIERIHANESMSLKISQVIEMLEDAFQSAISLYPAKPFSGLIEQQRWFKRLKS